MLYSFISERTFSGWFAVALIGTLVGYIAYGIYKDILRGLGP